MQFTVRLPRVLVTGIAILVASIGVAAVLPATAESGSSIVVCIDPTTQDLTVNPTCTGSTLTWAQQGVPGANGATGATGATGPAGPPGAAAHLAKSHPALTAKIQVLLAVQSGTLSDVNDDLGTALAAAKKLAPSTDPTLSALQTEVALQGTEIRRLVNVLRALSKAQTQLLQGLQ